jgi:hypothetical protein
MAFNLPFGRKIDKMALKYEHLPLQDLPKFTKIGIFGLIIHHLATEMTYLFGALPATPG